MIRVFALTIFLFIFFALELSGQIHSKEYWKMMADDSKAIVVGTVEEDYRVIRPDKFKPNPDGSSPTDDEIYLGRVFRVKVTEKLKGKIKTKKIVENKYVNIFLFGAHPTLGIGSPSIFKGKENVFFLEPNSNKKLEGIGTIDFNKQNYDIITKPFDYKSSYTVVDGFRGSMEIKTNKENLIKEVKRAID